MLLPEDEELSGHLNVVSFSETIEHTVFRGEAEGYLNAIVKFCEQHNLDFSEVTKFISPSLKEKIELEASNDGMMAKKFKQVWHFD